MGIDLSNSRQIVLFEIDRDDPHELHRFHRAISQLMVESRLGPNEFEEVVGMHKGAMNVAYVMTRSGFRRGFDRLEWYMRKQTEVYEFDLDTCELVSLAYDGQHWRSSKQDWAHGYAVGENAPATDGWTYFPGAKHFFTILSEEQTNA
jgi:hypothetical protein